tara:strand:- start:452 stop:1225 length:774 start_codon:yes stop_codon:yes gene_type:complete
MLRGLIMRQPLVAGNWKMNGSPESVKSLLDELVSSSVNIKNVEIAVCSPHIFLGNIQAQLKDSRIAYGGQDLSIHPSGAYTGETSGAMLIDFGCKYVIIGHSERRQYHGESNSIVSSKFGAALKSNLIPIFCIGETLEERESGIMEDILSEQLDAVINDHGVDKLGAGVIAYEPVWAIGTGKTASPSQAQEVHSWIRNRIAVSSPEIADSIRILYGGSMNPNNASDLIAESDIDGGLIGGASLKSVDFMAIAEAADL